MRSAHCIILFTTVGLAVPLHAGSPDEPASEKTLSARKRSPSSTVADSDADDIVVTGSLLSHQGTGQSSPITVISQADLVQSGVTTISDALRSLSADGAGSISTGFQGGTAAGASGLSLRGLGVSSTLILIDGQRMVNYPVDDDAVNAFFDLGSIPINAVDRIEILRDSASSIYGSGAMGGVVNIITKKTAPGITVGGQAGITQDGGGAMRLANIGVGFGDFERRGFSGYVGGEYESHAAIAGSQRGFPYDTQDLTSIDGLAQNYDGQSIPTTTTTALVARTTQRDLNDPFSGGSTLIPSGTQASGRPYYQFTALNLDCAQGSFTFSTGTNRGTTCRHDNVREYSQIQPRQIRWALFSRASARLGDDVELNLQGIYSHVATTIRDVPMSIRQNQPAGTSPTLSGTSPAGIILPVYVCASGVDCATAADRQLNPNNPYAAAYANDPTNGAARIYYRFGDIPKVNRIRNDVLRTTASLTGSIADAGFWAVDATLAHDRLTRAYSGVINIAGLRAAINTGAYDFVDPGRNSAAVRALVAPTFTVHADNWLGAVTGRISAVAAHLPGGEFRLSAGGEFRRETQHNPGLNADFSRYQFVYAVNGEHSVVAGFAEAALPLLRQLQINLSGRIDHYSEGFERFSPKAGFRFEPVPLLTFRGSWSRNFGAPSFSTNSRDSLLGGATTFVPPTAFQLAHGGLTSGGNTNPYARQYTVGLNYIGNGLKPETAKSLSLGIIVKPVDGLSVDINYFRIDKKDSISHGLAERAAINAYYAGQPLPAGYSIATLDVADPLYPDAMRRLLAINVPYMNGTRFRTAGLDFEVTAKATIARSIGLNSRLILTEIFYSNAILDDGTVEKFAGTLGPYTLSSGAGTPRLKGTWQTTASIGKLSTTAIAHYVSHIKNVAADVGTTDCSDDPDSGNLYPASADFCHIRSFAYLDLNLEYALTRRTAFSLFVGNITAAHAPLAPASYSGVNYLPSWHLAGVIGRTFRVGLRSQL